MASCKLGASTVKFANLLGSGTAAVGFPSKPNGRQILIGQKINRFPGLTISPCLKNPAIFRCGVSSEPDVAAEDVRDAYEETNYSGVTSKLIPKPAEVESLIDDICNTSIAEFEMNLGGFHLFVARDLHSEPVPPLPPIAATETANKMAEMAYENGSVSTQSLALSKPVPSSGRVQALLDKAADEGLVILKSPRVGYFRRSRTIKGKRAPPPCNEKQAVKEGKVICYVEQLGGLIPIESDVAGEVIKMLKEDGDPVGYGDPLVAILPSFPGIKMLQ